MFDKILMPTDGSDLSLTAADRAVELARLAGATLLAVYVQDPYPYSGVGAASRAGLNEHLAGEHRRAAAAFGRVLQLAQGKGVRFETALLEGSNPAEQIVEAARHTGADQIVMASHGRTGVARMLLGSVARNVLDLSPIPVLIVKCQ
jgi:nucleotide-binding universal stress UspA family protein